MNNADSMLRLTGWSPVLLVLAATLSLHASQWPQWRGPDRNGVAPAAADVKAWPDKLTRTWMQPLGEGYSSPVVDGGRVFVHSREDPEEIVTAFELDSGEQVWTMRYPAPFRKNK